MVRKLRKLTRKLAARRSSVKDDDETEKSTESDGKQPSEPLQPPLWESQPPSRVLGDKRVHDITSHFRAAAAELPTATLIKSDSFTLFESVTALEIMDPKMDSGYLAPGETLEDQYDVCRDILPEEVVGIMDQLLCCEMAWHEGYPLSQTVFTSHYVDKLLDTNARSLHDAVWDRSLNAKVKKSKGSAEELVRETLRLYCVALIKCCHYVIQKITASGHYYEEEDFSTHTYGRELFPEMRTEDVLKALEKLQDLLTRT
jgi:N-alpha-acetyltransferase 35, NatC auxiliary subunit